MSVSDQQMMLLALSLLWLFATVFLDVRLVSTQALTSSDSWIKNKFSMVYLLLSCIIFGGTISICNAEPDVDRHVLLLMVIIFFVCMIAENMLLFYVFQKYTKSLREQAGQQTQLHYQKAEIERLAKSIVINENCNEIIHNTSHYLKVIGQLAYECGNQEICDIVGKLNGTLNKKNVYEYSSHNMLNAILTDYSARIKGQGMRFDVYVEPKCALGHIPDIDLITMLGNLLDNAMSAAIQKGKNALINVRIFMRKNGKLCVIKVVNDFTGELKLIGGKPLSTKKEAGLHGIGITSVSKIAEHYHGYLECYVENEKFCAVLVFPVDVDGS